MQSYSQSATQSQVHTTAPHTSYLWASAPSSPWPSLPPCSRRCCCAWFSSWIPPGLLLLLAPLWLAPADKGEPGASGDWPAAAAASAGCTGVGRRWIITKSSTCSKTDLNSAQHAIAQRSTAQCSAAQVIAYAPTYLELAVSLCVHRLQSPCSQPISNRLIPHPKYPFY